LSRPLARGVTPRARPSAQEVAAKKKVIAWKYKRQRLQRDPDSINKTLMGRRRNETEDLIRYRFETLPDTDDRDIFLRLWAWSNAYSRAPSKDLHEFGGRLGVLLSDAEVETTVAYVQAHPRRFSARTFGKRIRLTKDEWLRHRPTTMVPFDITPKELERLRRAIKTERERERSRRKGAEPRAEWLKRPASVGAKPRGRPTIGDKAMTGAERVKRHRDKARAKVQHPVTKVPVEHLTDLTGQDLSLHEAVSCAKGKDPQAMKDCEQGTAVSEGTLSLRTLPSRGGKATSSAPGQIPHASAAADAFAGHHAEVVDAASVYGELPLELRLMALGLSSPVVTTERDQPDGADRVAA
jgi:hypothetical protein